MPKKVPTLNRKAAPAICTTEHIPLPVPRQTSLSNGCQVYLLDFPSTEILKVEVVFRAGRPEEDKKLVSHAVARMLREGTRHRTAAEIAEWIDFWGGTFSNPSSLDTSNFVLFAQKKYASQLIPIFAELLTQPAFPQQELDNFRRTSIADLKIELEKPEVVAYRKITEMIYGSHHPYGYNSTPEDYEALTINDLQSFFQKWYTPANATIFLSGQVDDTDVALLERYFGTMPAVPSPPRLALPVCPQKPEKLAIEHPNSLQKAVKVGRRLFNKHHPDFALMYVLNTVLGGYFGSRLMTNIREKKGLTYNIYSAMDAMLHDGCFYIATEVNPDKANVAVREIYREMKKLCDQPVPLDELEMVKNYLLGTLLTSLDGALNTSEVVRNLVVEGLTADDFQHLVATIRGADATHLQQLAQKYFQPKDFWQVVVG